MGPIVDIHELVAQHSVQTGAWESNSAVACTEISAKSTIPRHLRGILYGSLRKECHAGASLRSVTRKHPKTMPQHGLQMAYLTESSVNHAAKRRFYGPSQGNFRKTCRKEALSRRIFTEASEKHVVDRHPCDISPGRLRETNRREDNLRTSLRKTPRNKPF